MQNFPEISGIRIGVLKGGISNEREVSLESGQQAADALRRQGCQVIEIDIATRDEGRIVKELRDAKIEVAFIALHGAFGEDGGIQSILERLDIPYTGSGPRASACAFDKIQSKKMFRAQGIFTPRSFVIESSYLLPSAMQYPKVVKPDRSGSSLGVTIAYSEKELQEGIEKGFSISEKLLIEEYIEGRELSVGILDCAALGVVEIVPVNGYYDYRSKYTEGMVHFQAPAQLSPELSQRIVDAAYRAHQSVGARHFSRVDLRLSKENVPYVLEINSIPGLTSHSLLPLSARVCGISFECLIASMVGLALGQERLLGVREQR